MNRLAQLSFLLIVCSALFVCAFADTAHAADNGKKNKNIDATDGGEVDEEADDLSMDESLDEGDLEESDGGEEVE